MFLIVSSKTLTIDWSIFMISWEKSPDCHSSRQVMDLSHLKSCRRVHVQSIMGEQSGLSLFPPSYGPSSSCLYLNNLLNQYFTHVNWDWCHATRSVIEKLLGVTYETCKHNSVY